MRMSFHYTHFVIKSNHHVKSEIEEIMLIWGLQREQQHILELILVTGFFRLSWDRKKVVLCFRISSHGDLTQITWVRAGLRLSQINYFSWNLFWDLSLFPNFYFFLCLPFPSFFWCQCTKSCSDTSRKATNHFSLL